MAEIRIQRKRRHKVWPLFLLLGALVLVLLPFGFLGDGDDEAPPGVSSVASADSVPATSPAARSDTTTTRDTAGRVTATAGGAVAPTPAPPPATGGTRPDSAAKPPTLTAFERFITAPRPRAGERAERRYTADALRRLADELRAVGASGAGVSVVRANADSLRVAGGRYVDYARAGFVAAVRELDVLRERHAATVDTGRLRSAAWAIRPGESLLEQRGRVQTFFERARDALQSLPRRQ